MNVLIGLMTYCDLSNYAERHALYVVEQFTLGRCNEVLVGTK